MTPGRDSQPRPAGPAGRPHIAEWFGHRVFPEVSSGAESLRDQRGGCCPFLTKTLKSSTPCVKARNSRGVCSISANSNGHRQDWLVCPYRALDDRLLSDMVRRLYGVQPSLPVLIRPVLALTEQAGRSEILRATRGNQRVFVYFQDKLGGEIGLSRTAASPELSFDITVVELLPASTAPTTAEDLAVSLGKYGVIELQTTDTHGSYQHAVTALANALDLHRDHFPALLAENSEWAGRRIEGPNISNVFKRTFYQIAFKFQVTKRESSAGCALALPQPVWDSWQPFLGAPDLHRWHDGTWRLLDDHSTAPTDWIYVFDIDDQPRDDGLPAPINVRMVIGTDARTLSRAAFEVAPARATAQEEDADAIGQAIARRLGRYLPGVS